MDTTSSNLPVCVYCGTARPADETSCPTCGRAWIDVRVGDLADDGTPPPVQGATVAGAAATPDASEPTEQPASNDATDELAVDDVTQSARDDVTTVPPPPPAVAASAAAVAGADDTGEFSFDDWTLPPDKPPSRARWIIPVILLAAVVVVWALVFIDRDSTPTTTIAAATTTTEGVTTTTTEGVTTTTEPTTTTEGTSTTTTMAVPPPTVWPPIGDPIPTDELALRAAGIGPLDIGAGLGEVAGRLTSSLGEAEASGSDAVCEPEAYWLQWGDLRVVFDGFASGATFVSYRYEDVGSETDLGLTTLSGLALGDTVADLQSIYSSFTITFEVIDGQDVFRLVDGGELLLWGPVTSMEPDGVVIGIYSPGPCDQG
jgi:hypothetical protein